MNEKANITISDNNPCGYDSSNITMKEESVTNNEDGNNQEIARVKCQVERIVMPLVLPDDYRQDWAVAWKDWFDSGML